MANFSILVPLIVAFLFVFSPSLSSSSSSSSKSSHNPTPTPTIAAAPAALPGPPLSPYRELSPDIAPLLPSPGGSSATPTIIPSTRSPPNPDQDQVSSVGPDPAFAPSGLLQAASGVHLREDFSSFMVALLLVQAVVVVAL